MEAENEDEEFSIALDPCIGDERALQGRHLGDDPGELLADRGLAGAPAGGRPVEFDGLERGGEKQRNRRHRPMTPTRRRIRQIDCEASYHARLLRAIALKIIGAQS